MIEITVRNVAAFLARVSKVGPSYFERKQLLASAGAVVVASAYVPLVAVVVDVDVSVVVAGVVAVVVADIHRAI